MAPRSSKTFQRPGVPGSLSDALRLWQQLRVDQREEAAILLAFTLSCPSESRATRVAGFLRRRNACERARIEPVGGPAGKAWQVRGTMREAVHTLADLEATWTWLREAADSHQVALVSIGLDPATA